MKFFNQFWFEKWSSISEEADQEFIKSAHILLKFYLSLFKMSTNSNSIMEPISLSDTEEIEEEIVTNMEELPVVKSEPLEVEVNNVNDIQALFNPDDIPTPKGMLKVYMATTSIT